MTNTWNNKSWKLCYLALCSLALSLAPVSYATALEDEKQPVEDPQEESTQIEADDGGMALMGEGGESEPGIGDGAASPFQSGAGAGIGSRGAFSYNYPFVSSPGRAGLNGSAGLGYSGSGLSDNNLAGYGWHTPMAGITRSTRYGIDQLYSNDLYYAGDGELILVNSNAALREYRPRLDGGFNRYFYDVANAYWYVYDRSGNKTTYGSVTNSRSLDTNNPTRIFSWYLDEVRDIHGNYVNYSYYKDSGAVYPKEIKYTGFGTNDGLMSIRFQPFFNGPTSTNVRPDPTVSYATGFRIKQQYRLERVESYANGQLAAKYDIKYTNGNVGVARSLVSSIQRYGNDSTSTLPAVSFTYHTPSFSNTQVLTSYSLPDDLYLLTKQASATNKMPGYGAVQFADVNGDSLVDVLYANGCHSGNGRNKRTWLNTGDGWMISTNWDLPTFECNGRDRLFFLDYVNNDLTPDSTGVEIVDFNGDSRPDILIAQSYMEGGIWVDRRAGWRNTGSGWVRDDRWVVPTNYAFLATYHRDGTNVLLSTGVQMPDVNADGFADLVYAVTNHIGSFSSNHVIMGKATWLNSGSGWVQSATWVLPTNFFLLADLVGDSSAVPEDGSVRFADINNDGLVDFVYANGHADAYQFPNGLMGSPGRTKETWINNGAGWRKDDAWKFPTYMLSDDTSTNKADLLFFVDDLINRGATVKDPYTTGVRLTDINGDGRTDILLGETYYDYYYAMWVDARAAWLNCATGWIRNDNYAPPPGYSFLGVCLQDGFWYIAEGGSSVLDLTGDGTPEYLYARSVSYGTAFPLGKKARQGVSGNDIMMKVYNGLGGCSEVEYKSGALTEDYSAPFSVGLVSALRTYDGMGNVYTSRYEYSGGWYYISTNNDRRNEFRGFHKTIKISADGARSMTYCHQGGGVDGSAMGEGDDVEAKKGLPYRTEIYGNDGKLYARSISKYETITITDAVRTNELRYWTKPTESVSFTFEGLSNHRETAGRTYFDDTLGLPTNSVSLGEVQADPDTGDIESIVPGDELYTFTEYASFTNTWIKGRPSRVRLTSDASGANLLGETIFGYKSSSLPEYSAVWLDEQNTYVTNGVVLSYDQYGNPISARDAIGVVTTTTYDDIYHAYPISINVGGMIASTTFDPRSGQSVSSQSPLGIVSSNRFDALFRPLKSWVDGVWVSEIEYTAGGIVNGIPRNSVHVKANNGSAIAGDTDAYSYADGLGRVIQARSESERGDYRISNKVFDEVGRITHAYEPYFEAGGDYKAFSPSSPVVTYSYDPLGRVVQVTPRTGESDSPTAPTSTAFTDGANLWAQVVTDAQGKIKKVYKDAYGHTLTIEEYDGVNTYQTTFRYDILGRMTNVIDIQGNVIRVYHDSMGRKIRMDDPDMGTWQYGYDVLGRMTNQIDAKGQQVSFDYTDPWGRLKTKRVYDAQSNLENTVTYYYDSSDDPSFTVYTGQLYKVVQTLATNRFSYNNHGLVLKSRVDIAGFGSYDVTNAYDELDRPTIATYPNGVAKVQYNYGSIGNLESISSLTGVGNSNVTFYKVDTINELGHVEKATYGNSVESRFSYYPLSRRLRQTTTGKANGDIYQSLGYKYTQGGLIRDITDNVWTGEQAATLSNIQYDNWYRLISVTRFDPATNANRSFTFAYDPAGNILLNDDFSTDTYEYTDPRPHALSAIGTNEFQYDDIGNITNSLGRVLEYDARNRLKKATTASGVVATFQYLDSGARLIKQVVADGVTNTTLYLGGIYEEENGRKLCHVFFGGKRVASFTPIAESGGQALGMLERFAKKATWSDAASRWMAVLPPAWNGGPSRYCITGAYTNPNILLRILQSSFVIALFLLLFLSSVGRSKPSAFVRNYGGTSRLSRSSSFRSPPHSFFSSFAPLRHCVNLFSFRSLSSSVPFRVFRGSKSSSYPLWSRSVSLVLIICLFLGSTPSVSQAQMVFPRGDVNGDQLVDMADALLIQQVVDGIRKMDDSVFNLSTYANGDVNYDGVTNETDVRIIVDYALGMRSLPDEPDETQKFIYYHADHLGSGNIVTDRMGNIVQHTEYTPFGEKRFSLDLGVSINDYLYTGQEYDEEIGLYYYNARYYDSKVGRFIQPDTIVPGVGDSQAFNRYAYVRNNPVMGPDPSGHGFDPFDGDDWEDLGDDVVQGCEDAAGWVDDELIQPTKDLAEDVAEEVDDAVIHPVADAIDDVCDFATDVFQSLPPVVQGYAMMTLYLNPFTTLFVQGAYLFDSGFRKDVNENVSNNWQSYATTGATVAVGILTAGAGFAAAGALGFAEGTLGTVLVTGAVSGAISGLVAGGLGTALAGGDLADCIKAGGWSALSGAAIGIASAAAFYGVNHLLNDNSVWVGYSEDQLETLKTKYPSLYEKYINNSNIDFVECPSWEDYEYAMTSGDYTEVYLHTHGGGAGLEFSDGIHSLTELNGTASSIQTDIVGISSCYNNVQFSDWSSLGTQNTEYMDLSATGLHSGWNPAASDRNVAIKKVFNTVFSSIR